MVALTPVKYGCFVSFYRSTKDQFSRPNLPYGVLVDLECFALGQYTPMARDNLYTGRVLGTPRWLTRFVSVLLLTKQHVKFYAS